MKKTLGIIILLCTIALFAIIICRIWGIYLFSWQDIVRSGVTLLLLVILIIVIATIYFLFLRKQDK